MEEPSGQTNPETIRAILALARQGGVEEAQIQALQTIQTGGIGRKQAARYHLLLSSILIDVAEEPHMAAILHAEQAVHLAELAGDRWIRGQALERLARAASQCGEPKLAQSACDRLEEELGRNPAVIDGGFRHLWRLRLRAALAAGDDERAMEASERALEAAGEADVIARAQIRMDRVPVLLSLGRLEEAGRALEAASALGLETKADCRLARLLLGALQEPDADDRPRLARRALEACIASGRADLCHRYRRLLNPLL